MDILWLPPCQRTKGFLWKACVFSFAEYSLLDVSGLEYCIKLNKFDISCQKKIKKYLCLFFKIL